MLRINQIKIEYGKTKDEKSLKATLKKKAAGELHVKETDISGLSIVKHSIDARKKPLILDVYSVDVILKDECEERILQSLKGAALKNVKQISPEKYSVPKGTFSSRPVIAGAGPAGLFCAYVLALAGLKPILIERGKAAGERGRDVENFWKGKSLDPESNVLFGEGGAGTFSDGKLYTSLSGEGGRLRFILETFVRHGADKNILYEANPHIGTDRLRSIVSSIRESICEAGGEVFFSTKLTGIHTESRELTGIHTESRELTGIHTESRELTGIHTEGRELTGIRTEGGVLTGIEVSRGQNALNDGHGAINEFIETDILVIATGHSARDTFAMLKESGVYMEKKPFAMGVRIAHPQRLIDEAMYGKNAPHTFPPAAYKLTTSVGGRSVYSFCMCPGGYIVNSASEEGGLCVNGMSYSGRSGECANSAIVVNIRTDDFAGEDVLSGCAFQRELEERAYKAGDGKIPFEYLGSFFERGLAGSVGKSDSKGLVTCTTACIKEQDGSASVGKEFVNGMTGNLRCEKDLLYERIDPGAAFKGLYTEADVGLILPAFMRDAIISGITEFEERIRGFSYAGALVAGIESRTSSPVRISRGEDLQSVSVRGLYPCGEGAGYAGGIMSAALDGLKAAEKIIALGQNF